MDRGRLAKERDKEFLGQGIGFPFQLSPSGRLGMVAGPADIDESIRIVLGTVPGERLMRPEFGCRVHELLFAPHDLVTEGLIVHYVKEALGRWEPRIAAESITVDERPPQDGAILVKIQYRILATHNQRSIVYPFFLLGPEE